MVPELAQRRLVIVPQLIDERMARTLYYVLLLRHWRGEAKRDRQAPGADSHWGDSTLDAMLLGLKPGIEQASGCQLLPTYAYARLYFHGDELARHRDRASCQVAATIHLGCSGGQTPPIWFEPDVAITQRPGDAVIYLGDSIDHWREPFRGGDFGQLFLNYVFADGARANLIHDGRRNAFPPSLSPSPMPGILDRV
ncbi:hypothetical protein [Cupriavidus oxalaticus]|uniref:Uncharacterized protein n=1 Tax=Cupriavidus oxalaticus TaxID=96344 RepID=A0A4P7LRY4_9BURK|nr:hypothetical protein [Cupriavidus oxalaticus]QBY56433.1 hypothetical protein E0W60_36165 [Cupriavidus oxalaticus]